ncbi:MAG TPA: hypothetical protein VOB72_18775 [Candidatus Dormibacteraeota bacterium]|nr:hypothetical protein [Candidatus Dormibacteraeota bacterium]
MKHRVQPCTAATIEGRLARAIEFYESAEELRRLHPEWANAWVTSYVLAGIAAADVICCRALGHHASGDNHVQAVSLLRTVQPDGPELSTALGVLLGMKTAAGYGQRSVSAQDQARAPRRAKQLVDGARQRT